MRKSLVIKTVVGALVIGASSCYAASSDQVVAKLGATELKQSQIKSLVDELDGDTRKQLLADPASLSVLVRKEIIRLAIAREAFDKQWDKRPEVQSQLDQAREQVIVTSYLNSIARPSAGYPAEDEIKQAYEANKTSFTTPTQYHIAQIYISRSADNQESVAKKVNELVAKAGNGDFSQLASQHSEHKESAARGGDMGWLPETQLIPELRDQLPKISPGQISKPIMSGTGWHIVKLLETKPPALQTLGEVRETIIASLRLRKAKQLEQQYLEELLKTRQLSINEIALGELLK